MDPTITALVRELGFVLLEQHQYPHIYHQAEHSYFLNLHPVQYNKVQGQRIIFDANHGPAYCYEGLSGREYALSEDIPELLKDYLRQRGFPVDQVLRQRRLRALLA